MRWQRLFGKHRTREQTSERPRPDTSNPSGGSRLPGGSVTGATSASTSAASTSAASTSQASAAARTNPSLTSSVASHSPDANESVTRVTEVTDPNLLVEPITDAPPQGMTRPRTTNPVVLQGSGELTQDHPNFWRRARSLWRETDDGSSGTASLMGNEVELAHARAVVDVTARIGSEALHSGASAADSTAMMLRVLQAYRVNAHIDTTYTSVTVSHFGALDRDPITVMRIVPGLGADYRRLAEIQNLVDRITGEGLPVGMVRGELVRIARLSSVFRPWVNTTAAGLLGMFVALLLGGSMVEAVVAAGITTGIHLVQRWLGRRRVPVFFGNVAGAALCGLVALGTMWVRSATRFDTYISGSILVAAGMVSMLAGLSMVAAVQDAMDAYYLTASARLLEVLVLTGAVVLGLTMTLYIGLQLGVPAYLTPSTGGSPLWLSTLSAAMIAMSFAVSCHLRPGAVIWSAGFGVVAWLVNYLLVGVVGVGAAAGAAALSVGLGSQVVRRISGIPTAALIRVGIVALVPGMSIYRGILSVVALEQGNVSDASPMLLLQAVIIAVMLAAGAAAGELLGRPLNIPKDWASRLAFAKAGRRSQEQSPSR